jgi:transglutaminase-like putative cysteine protease
MRLSVTHETRYGYANAVEQAHHIAHMRPLASASQQLLSHTLSIQPEPASLASSTDSYGQQRVYFELAVPHAELIVTAHSEVITHALPPEMSGKLDRVSVPDSLPWEAVAEHMQYHSEQEYDAAREFAQASPLAPIHPTFAKYASAVSSKSQPVYELAKALCQRIHNEFEYSPEATDASTPPQEAFALKKGVCQDFAQVMIAGLRSLGLAARYVSGYLLTEPPPGRPRLIGADASHAWVSVYCPKAGWLDFDPTNNCLAGESHVKLAYGRDYGDVPPLRGVIRGGGDHTLAVAVTVAPLDQSATVLSAQSQSQSQSQTQGQRDRQSQRQT